jgi:hypothetical protein
MLISELSFQLALMIIIWNAQAKKYWQQFIAIQIPAKP